MARLWPAAIKLYREQNNVGLKEAKDAVDKIEAELRSASPNKFSAAKAGGCFGIIALFAGIAVCGLVLIAMMS